MTADPILRAHAVRDHMSMTVYGGLHYLRGNSAPYFSLTASGQFDVRQPGGEYGGCCHDEILKWYPEMVDLAALHLSDIDGTPMHAEANGWYYLAGCYPDAFGERYHGGNANKHFPDGYRKPTSDECLEVFADHCRVPLAEAATIRDKVQAVAMAAEHSRNAIAKATLAEIMATMRPRWKAEAEAAIAKHGLVVYGNTWPTKGAA